MPQVWVITGDKQETAINIAISCKLIRNPDSLLICNASTRDEAHARLRELQSQLRQSYAPMGGPKEGPPPNKGTTTALMECCFLKGLPAIAALP